MDVQIGSVSVIHVSLSESEAQEFLGDASAVQTRVYELLYPMNAKSTKSPKKVARRKKTSKPGPKSGTLICTSCGRAFKQEGSFQKHVAKCQQSVAGDVPD